MQKRADYTWWLLCIAFFVAALIAVLWFTDLMTDRSALTVLGACWEFLGAFTLVASLLFHHLGLFRLQKQLLEREKAIPTDWVRRFPLRVAFHLGPKEPPEGQETNIESYATLFWGTLLLVFGFLMQAVSQLPWLDSNPQSVTLTVSHWEAQMWKRWMIGLIFSLVVGGFVTELFLNILRSALGISKPTPEERSIPPWLTGAVERLFFTVLLGVESVTEFASEIPTTMVAWIGLKLATNWNHYSRQGIARTVGFSAMLAGLISMLFAFVGGLLCRGLISFGLG